MAAAIGPVCGPVLRFVALCLLPEADKNDDIMILLIHLVLLFYFLIR